MSNYVLRLYVTGRTARSMEAIGNIESILAEHLNGEYELEIIDVLERPQRAEDEKVIATPTLIKLLPQPTRRIIGDLSNRGLVATSLDLNVGGKS